MAEYRLDHLVDMAQARQLLESHHRLSGMAYGLLDTDGNILADVGWQEICVRFHNANPVSSMRCMESNAYMQANIYAAEGYYAECRCGNGMIDTAIPLVINGTHMATLFSGQFFYDDNPPDREFFRAQALTFGFDPEEYLKALDNVPVLSRKHVHYNLLFLRDLVNVLAETGRNNLRLIREMENNNALLSAALDDTNDAVFLVELERFRFVYVNAAACRSLGYSREELLTMTPPDINPDLTAEMRVEIMEKTLAGLPVVMESCHRARDGRVFPVEISISRFEYDGARFSLSVARDISARKRAEDALRFVAQRGWTEGGEKFCFSLARYLGKSFNVDYVIIDKLTNDPSIAETVALYAKGEFAPTMRYDLKCTPCDSVMGKTLCCYPSGVRELFPDDTLLKEMNVESYIGIPLWDFEGRANGLIALMDAAPMNDTASIANVLQLVATRAAAELERESTKEKLLAKQQKLTEMTMELSMAEERERRRIATELHDNISQSLLLGKIKLRSLIGSHSAANDLEEILDIQDRTIRSVRSLTQQLSPPILSVGGLEDALEWLAKRMMEDYGLRVSFVDDQSRKPLTGDMRAIVYQACRELLINVAKHAETGSARLIAGREVDRLYVTVEDRGAGFDPSGIAAKGFGLFSIRERIRYLGGDVAIESAPGRGTRVTLRVALSEPQVSV